MKVTRVLNLFTIMNRGGAETMVMNYYRNIDREKVQFDFMVHRQEEGAYEQEIRELGGKIYRMIPIYPQNFKKYQKMICDFFDVHDEYDIIHSHMSELGYFVLKEAKKRGISVRICHAHNAPHGWDLKMFMRTYFKWQIKKYYTHMFVCGIESGDWLFGRENRDKFIMQNNAIDAEKFRYTLDKSALEKEKLSLQDKLVVGHVGRFNKQKNHEFLIEIFREIHKLNNSAVLVMVGTGELENQIKEKTTREQQEKSIIFLESRDDVNDIMQAFDLFLFPSLFEGLPVTMVEAQAAGLQCFISDKIPQECILTNNVEVIGLTESAEQWAKTILNSMKDFERKDTYQEIRKKNFDIKKNAEWLEEFYLNERGE